MSQTSSSVDWAALGTAIAAFIGGAWTWLRGRKRRRSEMQELTEEVRTLARNLESWQAAELSKTSIVSRQLAEVIKLHAEKKP